MSTVSLRPRISFHPPHSATAPSPARFRGLARDEVRMLVATTDALEDSRFRSFALHLNPGDVVVVNNSAVLPAQLDGRSSRHGDIVVHLGGKASDAAGEWDVELRVAPDAASSLLDAQAGDQIRTGATTLTLLRPHDSVDSSPTGIGNRLWLAHVDGDIEAEMARRGRPISYGYLDRQYPLEEYQSIFASIPGSVESPSAALPFTEQIATELVSRGIGVHPITLHTGVSSQEAGERPQREWFDVPHSTADAVNSARARGSRVVAVGTTVTRAIESAFDGTRVQAVSRWTDRLVTPHDPPHVINGLVTGWHDPMASHLLLVEAVAGLDLAQRAYDHASAAGYLWHEFGDSALLLPQIGRQ